jgi:hypothetical protein
LTPLDIASDLQALINLSKEVPFSRIADHIEEKKRKKRHEDIKNLRKKRNIGDGDITSK